MNDLSACIYNGRRLREVNVVIRSRNWRSDVNQLPRCLKLVSESVTP